MKKVIDGKVYNTETARLVGIYDNGLSISDFDYIHEYLYQKKDGQYFLHGIGGPATVWAHHTSSHSRTDGDGWRLLTKEKAIAWAESHEMDADSMISEFDLEDC